MDFDLVVRDIGCKGMVYNSTGAIVKNLASNVNLSYYMGLWTLGSKLQKNNCWTFFQ